MNCQLPATTIELVRVSEMICGARALIFDVDGKLAETEKVARAMHSPSLVAESPVM
jgi:hypothetical protein